MWGVIVSVLRLMALCFVVTNALKLPDYIKPCARDDPDINECGKLHAQAAVSQFVKGDRKYKVPVLDPLLIPEMSIHQDSGSRVIGLGFVATDLFIRGLKDLIIEGIILNVKNDSYEYNLRVPKMEISSKYNVSGRVLILPISGSGNARIEFDDVKMKYNYDIVLKEKDGVNFSHIVNPVFKFEVSKKMTMQLDNLFNGDKTLGKQMNLFLNENWRDVLLDIGPAIADTIGQILTRILGEIFKVVPYNDAWLH